MTRRDVIVLVAFCCVVVQTLKCFSCSFSYNEMYDPDNRDAWCANESLVQFDTEETTKSCASWEKFCVTAVTTINNAFTSVNRNCGERCSELCESVGYGEDQVNCDDCCEDDLCNANFSVQYYEEMMQRQFTSWSAPLPGEVAWNRRRNIKFPYSGAGGGSLSRRLSNFATPMLATFFLWLP